MGLFSDRVVVLRRLDYSETSQVLVLLGREHGKIRAIAKGIKRSTRQRFAAAPDLLDVGEVVVSARAGTSQELATLTEWRQTVSFGRLREKLSRLYAGQYAAEVASGLTADWDPHPGLYDALVRLLGRLCDATEPLAVVVDYLKLLLEEIGSAPLFDVCVGCDRPADVRQVLYFSSFEGGLLCRDCEGAHVEKRGVSPAGLAVLRGGQTADPSASAAAFDLLNYHVSHLMGRAPALAAQLLPADVARKGSR